MRKSKTPLQVTKDSVMLSSKAKPVQRILMMDDDPFFCHRNPEVLIRQGYEVNAAEAGGVGWEDLQLNHCHLVIIERDLPGLNGIEILKKLRSARRAGPVIMTTGKLSSARATRHAPLQPVVTLLKPHTITELLGAGDVVLGVTTIACEEFVPTIRHRPTPDEELKL